jgi:hypothetical protein
MPASRREIARSIAYASRAESHGHTAGHVGFFNSIDP